MSHWRFLVATLVVLAAAVVPAGAARATTMVYLSIDDLYQRSDLVVRGTVQSHTSFWTDEGQLFTDWTLGVDEVIQGQAVEVLTFRQMGGTVDDLTLHVPGDAELTDGEHVVLFLRHVDGMYYLTALGQSKLSVSVQGGLGVPGGRLDVPGASLDRVDATLVRDLSDIVFYRPEDDGVLYQLEDEILTLDQLREMRPAADQGGAE